MKDTNTEKQLPQEEVISKITLTVNERVADGAISITTQFDKTDTTLLVQSIAYMLDSAFNGNEEIAREVAGMLPGVVQKYFELKKAEEEEVTSDTQDSEEDLIELTELNIGELSELILACTEYEELPLLLAEVARRGLDGNGEGN